MIRPALALLLLPLALGLGAAAPARAEAEAAEALKAFQAALRSAEWKERRDAYYQLSGTDAAGVAQAMLEALASEPNPAVVLAGIGTLAGLRSSAAQDELAMALARGRGVRRLVALLALERQDGSRTTPALLEALGDKSPEVLAQAALAAGRRGLAEAVPALLGLLRHRDWQVRVAASRGLLRLASPPPPPAAPGKPPPPAPGVPEFMQAPAIRAALLEALEQGRGRERTEHVLALERLTGEGHGDNPAAWALVLAGKPVDPRTAAQRTWPAHAFGIPLAGRRLVFVLDNSLRSGDPHRFGTGARMEEVCAVPGGTPLFGSRLRTVGQFAHAHLERAVKDLPGETRFNVLTFNEKVSAVFERPVASNPGTRKTLAETLAGLKVDNGIASYDALTQALDLAGSKDSVAWAKGPDEILFVTCNMPTMGEIVEADVVAAAIALKARLRMVTIHTVGITEHPYDMLATIARETGGVYRNYYE